MIIAAALELGNRRGSSAGLVLAVSRMHERVKGFLHTIFVLSVGHIDYWCSYSPLVLNMREGAYVIL